jgi:hypothetical protein
MRMLYHAVRSKSQARSEKSVASPSEYVKESR